MYTCDIYHSFLYSFICWWVHRLVPHILKKISVNMGIWMSLQYAYFISFGYTPTCKLLDQMEVPFLIFFKNFPTVFSWWLHYFTFPPTESKDSFFLTSSSMLIIFCLFDNWNYPNKYEVISQCDFHVFLCFYLWAKMIKKEKLIEVLIDNMNK
jgi:hypothetical protein